MRRCLHSHHGKEEILMIIKENSEVILSTAMLQKNKLQNMKKQLEILLQKKIRLETEIKILKKSIKKKSKSFQFSLKSKINLEAFGEDLEPTDFTREFLKETLSQETISTLIEYDQVLHDIDLLLEEFKEEI